MFRAETQVFENLRLYLLAAAVGVRLLCFRSYMRAFYRLAKERLQRVMSDKQYHDGKGRVSAARVQKAVCTYKLLLSFCQEREFLFGFVISLQ